MQEIDPDRMQITEDMVPLTKKVRTLAKFFYNKEDAYNALEDVAKGRSLPFRRFAQESSTRWSSFYDHICSHLYNDAALNAYATYRGAGMPSKLEA